MRLNATEKGLQMKMTCNRTDELDMVVNSIIEYAKPHIKLAMPLGLGKANHIVNALYQRVKETPDLQLSIYTALTLNQPKAPSNPYAAQVMNAVTSQLYSGYPDLEYAQDRCKQQLPANIKVYEFFLSPGALLGNDEAQQSYINSNYTHAARDIFSKGINVIAQMVTPPLRNNLSLSCNPDVTLDLFNLVKKAGNKHKPFIVGEVNQQLPYLKGQAEVDVEHFDLLYTPPDFKGYKLFTLPQRAVKYSDYALAMHVSRLVSDGGTLQIGIGALGDAIAHCLFLRDQCNDVYKEIYKKSLNSSPECRIKNMPSYLEPFQKGLYANTEMLVEGLVYLREKQILRKKVYPLKGINNLLDKELIEPIISQNLIDTLLSENIISIPCSLTQLQALQTVGIIDQDDISNILIDSKRALIDYCKPTFGQKLKGGIYCHAGFYFGSQLLYERLRTLDSDSLNGLDMCSVNYVNHLYNGEALKRDQRKNACFVNSGMMLTLTGAAVSDGVADYQMVSGVGGQYNFVAQAHELEGARSIMCFQSTRTKNGELKSNIVWDYPHITIPRHLRDIVVTEYGIADLRSASDRDIIARILNITDSRFQKSLLKKAKEAGKIESTYVIPSEYQNNLPKKIEELFQQSEYATYFPMYPLGCDLDLIQRYATHALQGVQERSFNKVGLFKHILKNSLKSTSKPYYNDVYSLMGLNKPTSLKSHFMRFLIKLELSLMEKSQRPWLGR